jgi:hypothetical protein
MGKFVFQLPLTRLVFDSGKYWTPEVLGQLIWAVVTTVTGRTFVTAGLPGLKKPLPNVMSSIWRLADWAGIAAPAKWKKIVADVALAGAVTELLMEA